jgi:hypothetical protein
MIATVCHSKMLKTIGAQLKSNDYRNHYLLVLSYTYVYKKKNICLVTISSIVSSAAFHSIPLHSFHCIVVC